MALWPERRLSARESASSSIPPETASVRVSCGGPWSRTPAKVTVVSVTCRLGGLDAMVSQTLSSLPSMEPVDAPALGGLTRLPGWLCFA